MISSNLKSAWRNLRKNKAYSFINIFGLTAGLVSFLLIALYVFDELTYDGFHKKAASIYRVVETKTTKEGKQSKVVSVAANISEAAKKDLPEVSNATRFSMLGRTNVSNDENSNVFYESYFLADASFFNIFDFPVIEGDIHSALKEPHSIVITGETALKYFGRKQVLGKTLLTDRDSLPYAIKAVIDIPDNSHLRFNILFSENTLLSSQRFADFMNNDWTSNTFVTYFLLKNENVDQAANKMTEIVKSKRPDEAGTSSHFTLQPLKSIHFTSAGMDGNTDRPGNKSHLYIFCIVALFVLLIACINYMNLTTARFAGRSKEIAVRKVAGATRTSLIRQFLAESSLMTGIALVLALIIVKVALPGFDTFTGKQLRLGGSTDYRIWIGIAIITVFVGLLSGLYPALFQSSLKPFALLKSKFVPGKGNLSIRRVLVVFQFTLSIIMIIATLLVYRQMKYVDTADMGFNKEQLLVVDINSGNVRRSAETIKTEFARLPGVKSVSVTSRVPGEWKVIPKVKVRVPGQLTTPGEDVYFMGVDDQFMKTFNVKLLSGRNFMASPADSSAVILNEEAARMFNIKAPSEQRIEIPSMAFSGNISPLSQPFEARVVGIVKDFNFQSMREKVAPMIIGYTSNPLHSIDYFTSKVDIGNIPATMKGMQEVLHKIDAAHLFEYNFLDKQWEVFYREDQKRQVIFLGIAILTILIACLGLFGLATYAAEQRIKEIGIRKVLGASVAGIVSMLSKDFLKLVLVATLIAFPVAWLAMKSWLQGFAYRIQIGWWVFAASALLAVLIAFITISFQAIKAAVANPVKSLRAE